MLYHFPECVGSDDVEGKIVNKIGSLPSNYGAWGKGRINMYGAGYTLENKLDVIEHKRRNIIHPTIIIRIIAAHAGS